MNMTSLALNHFKNISSEMGVVDMPEWRFSGDVPVFYFTPMTVYENMKINKNIHEYGTDYSLELALLKLLDKKGERVFSSSDREALKKYGIYADFLKINKAMSSYFSLSSYEDSEKNSDRIVN